MKRIISIIIAAVMLLASVPSFAFLDDPGLITWEERGDIESVKSTGREWFFRPSPDARCEQNPPSFAWPQIDGATSYDLVIAKDKDFTDIAYEKYGLNEHFYNFSVCFETGVEYYWTVRYHTGAGTSKWREPSRFLVLPEAHEFPVPDIEDTIKTLKEWSHPKNIFNETNLEKFRAYKDKEESVKKAYDKIISNAKKYMDQGIATASSKTSSGSDILYPTAFAYIIGKDKAAGEFAKKQLIEMASWDPKNTLSYASDSSAFRETLLNMAVAFDWCYDLLNEGEKAKIVSAIRERLIIYEDPKDGLQDKVSMINYTPNISHGVNGLMNYFLPACIIMINEIPEAEEFIRHYLPLYINIAPVYSNEDGSWGVGVRYWCYVYHENIFPYTLNELTGINLYDKAWFENGYFIPLYLMSSSWVCEFSEGGNGSKVDGNHYIALCHMLAYTRSETLKWKMDTFGINSASSSDFYILNPMMEGVEAKAPYSYPRSHVFKDTGIAALHSDLINDTDKISLYFRSSPWGSYGHNHPDQNSFHIHAYGERLAIDSGYYDSFLSEFDKGYTKKSYAHNTITYDGGQGQPYQAGNADGKILNFLNHPDFDLVTGEASESYNHANGGEDEYNNIEKYKRHIIYLRPDTYVVVDDLKAGDNKEVHFEWWLNAVDNLSLYESRTGAEVIQGNAALDTKVHYPEVSGYYSDIFSGPDLVPYTPIKGDPPVTKRVWFEAKDKANETKFITTMGVRQKSENPTYVKKEDKKDFILLTFQDGTKVYVSKKGELIEDKNVKTDAEALVIKGESIMMVDGTFVERRGEKVISSDKKVSVTMGKDEIGVSAAEECNITLLAGDIKALKSPMGIIEEEKQFSRGFYWENTDGITNIKAYPGYYSYYMNDKPLAGGEANDSEFSYYIDGVEQKAELSGYLNHDGVAILSGKIKNGSGFYTIEEINNVKLKGATKGDRILLNQDENIIVSGEQPSLKLKSASSTKYDSVKIDDPDTFKNELNALTEAEDFTSKSGDGGMYNTRTFMSGGAGVTNFNNFGDSMTWELDVPENGNYDIVFKYVSWSSAIPGVAERVIEINGKLGLAHIAETENYGSSPEEWIASRIKTNVSLKKGKNKITVYPISGLWNIDWVGLIKSE